MSKKNEVISEEVFTSEAKEKAANLKTASQSDLDNNEDENSSLVAVPADSIPVNTALPCTVYMKKSGKMLVFRRQGERVNYKTALEFQKNGTANLFIHKAFWTMFMDSLEHLNIPASASPEVKAMHMRQLLLAYGQELDRQLHEPKKPQFDKLKHFAEGISSALQNDPSMGSKLLRKGTESADYFVNHAVNCAVYSTLIAKKLNMSSGDIKALTYAAIIHDIGNLFLPKRILLKKSKLTADEEDLVKTHARRGAEFISSLGAPGNVIHAVMQHHERIDGNGYPSGLKDKEIHLFARIIAIADAFDALTCNRPHQAGVSPQEAIQILAKSEGQFDRTILGLMGDVPQPKAA